MYRIQPCFKHTIAGLFLVTATITQAAYVSPQMGGGQVGMMTAPMIHADVSIIGGVLSVHLDTSHGTPSLRPLTGTDEFDPAAPWSVIGTQAYNFQFAWNPDPNTEALNANGRAIWIERIHHDPQLVTYLRTPMYNATDYGSVYPQILTTDGEIWKWSGSMQHNVYAVQDPTASTYTASYRVYVGDENTGAEVLDGLGDSVYGSETVNWTWNATPIPEPVSLITLIGGCVVLVMRRRG